MLKTRKWMKICFYAINGNWAFTPNGPFSYRQSHITFQKLCTYSPVNCYINDIVSDCTFVLECDQKRNKVHFIGLQLLRMSINLAIAILESSGLVSLNNSVSISSNLPCGTVCSPHALRLRLTSHCTQMGEWTTAFTRVVMLCFFFLVHAVYLSLCTPGVQCSQCSVTYVLSV